MWPLRLDIFLWITVLALKKITESILVVIALFYIVLVVDIYINTEKLSKVDSSLNTFCQNIASNSNFTKGPVIFRVDKGTLVYRLNPYFNSGGLAGYSPFFVFPHHRTVILAEEVLKGGSLTIIVSHELGHIQGGLKHLGPVKEMEQYANNFAVKVIKTQPKKEPQLQ